MLFGFTEYLKLFTFYTLALIGANTIYRNGVLLFKQKSIGFLLWIHDHFPRFYIWLTLNFGFQSEEKWSSDFEKMIPFTESIQKEIEQIDDEHLKEDVSKTLSKLQHLIHYGQGILETPKDFIKISDFKLKYYELTNQIFHLFETYYHQY